MAEPVGMYAAPRKTFEKNLKANGLDKVSPQINVLEGWFNDTLPDAHIPKISFLRIDSGLYVSTMDSLTNLYNKVSPGGIIYIDAYGTDVGSNHAVNDFR